MKKLVCGTVGIMVAVFAASADDVATDTSRLKAACQASDKLLWVERNQVCIPKNPCKDSKYESYCNRIYKDLEVINANVKQDSNNGSPAAMLLVEAYAIGHNLSCVPINDVKDHVLGQDYVLCMGDDVMVFEFGDINDIAYATAFSQSRIDEYTSKYERLLCEAMGGASASGVCHNISETQCEQLDQFAEDYGVYPISANWHCYGKHMDKCCIDYHWRSVLD